MDEQKTVTTRLKPEHVWPLTIASYDADKNRRLRLSSQLKLQQEVGELHLQAGGFPYSWMYDTLGIAFVLTRAGAVINRMPLFEEEVVLTTWSPGLTGIQYHRCYQFCDKAGNVLVDGMSTFALVDAKTHKLMRPGNIGELEGFSFKNGKLNACPVPGKIRLPEMSPAAKREVRYSDIDYNGHLNNTVYADFICDYMPGGMEGKQADSFSINFSGEAVEGEVLNIETAVEDDIAYFRGTHERGKCFEAMCKFSSI